MDTLVPLVALSYLLYCLGMLIDTHRQKETGTQPLKQESLVTFSLCLEAFRSFYTEDQSSTEEIYDHDLFHDGSASALRVIHPPSSKDVWRCNALSGILP